MWKSCGVTSSFLLLFSSAAWADAAAIQEGPWSQLRPSDIEASSFLQNNWNRYTENYHPNYVGDDNPKTAWVEGVSGNGEGQKLLLMTSQISAARGVKLKIRNGYQKSSGLLQANAAPREVRILLRTGSRVVATQTTELKREMGWQEVEITIPDSQGFDAVEFEVLSVHKGSRYQDTCISDVQLFVDSDVEWNQVVESARFRQLETWIADRQDVAAYFASQPVDYPFSSTVFQEGEASVEAADLAPLRESAERKRARIAGSDQWVELTVQHALRSPPDGLNIWVFDAIQDYLRADHFALFEAKDGGRVNREILSQVFDGGEVYEYGFTETSNFRVIWHESAPTVPDLLLFEHTQSVTERHTDTDTSTWLLDYDESGRLQEAYRWFKNESDYGHSQGWKRVVFTWNAAGRIQSVEEWVDSKSEEFLDEHYTEEFVGRSVYTAAAE